MSTRFFTNDGDNTLLNKFKGVFQDNPDIDCFDALVGYFRASGYFAIRPHLNNVPHIRILIGIDTDYILSRFNDEGLLFRGDDEATVKEALVNFKKDIATCKYDRATEEGICLFVEDVATGKIEIRAHKTRKLHAKIYIFRPSNWTENHQGSVITGSSNLTDAGLGASKISNYEFNVQLYEYDDVKFATSEFEKLWEEATTILPVQIKTLKTQTHLNDRVTPFELYIKMLSAYFGQSIDYNPDAVDMPPKYKKLSYQIDAVNQGYDKLCKYNGFFLADVVGLGKTVVALMIAKKFFFGNGFPDHISRILIICPPAVKKSWEKTVEDFGLKTCKIITNGSIHKEEKRFKSYDLVIVDEAHKFRTATSEGYDILQRLCKSPAPVGATLGKTPERKKIILISATPLNNSPADIQSQTYLFQDGGDTELDIPNLDDFFKQLIKRYDDAKKLDIISAKPIIQKINEELRNNIIFPLTVRRTRTDLINNELYRQDLRDQGIIFPESLPPVQLFYEMNEKLNNLFDRTLRCLSNELNYSRYMAIGFLKQEQKSRYNSIADISSRQLPVIMKNILIKRLDSSFFAFKKSLKRFLDSVIAMLTMLDNDRVYILHKVNVTDLILNGEEDKLEAIFLAKLENDPSVAIFHANDFEKVFREKLEQDKKALSDLWEAWSQVDDDPKYDKFLEVLKSDLLNKKKNPSGKIVIFSEAEDTTKYLSQKMHGDGYERVLAVYAENRNEIESIISENFDANIEKENRKNDYDIIISTEVLAEGVNLHRAGLIVNYDTPWNSTRLMQRVGRINRIGSNNKEIRIYNFFPTIEVNDTIELEKNASLKLLAFHHALGSDSQIYSPDDEEPGSFGLFNTNYTEEQDERLTILLWLRKFRDENPILFKTISDLPLKIRTGRKENETTSNMFQDDASVAYLRGAKRDMFFAVSKNESPKVISFLDAVKLLKCDFNEPRYDIPEIHYKHISSFLDCFEHKNQENAIKKNAISNVLSTAQKSALKYLTAMGSLSFVNDEERSLIEQAKDFIRKHKFVKLYKEVNNIAKNKLRPIDNLPALLKIVKRYVDESISESSNGIESLVEIEKKPDIIISETLVRETN
jgi:superfamily II DNA or RNA helicase